MKFKVEIFTQRTRSHYILLLIWKVTYQFLRGVSGLNAQVIDKVTSHDVELMVMVRVARARHCLMPAEIICQCHNPRTAFFNVPLWSLLSTLHFRFFAFPSHNKHNILDG